MMILSLRPRLVVSTTLLAIASTLPAQDTDHYVPPASVANTAPLVVRYEKGALAENDPAIKLLESAAADFQELQRKSPGEAFATNAEALETAATIVTESIAPFAPGGDQIKRQLADRSRAVLRNGFGYGVVAFPHVDIWTKATLKTMLSQGIHPPGLVLDRKTGMVDQRFIGEDGTVFPLVIVVDLAQDAAARTERTSAFLQFWLQTMRAAHDSLTSSYVFQVVQEVTHAQLTDKRLPPWLAEGLSYRVAHTATSRLLGEGTAREILDGILGPPISEPALRQAWPTLVRAPGGEFSPGQNRAAYDLIVAAQAASGNAFVRVVLTNAFNRRDVLQPAEVSRLYRSVAVHDADLLSL